MIWSKPHYGVQHLSGAPLSVKGHPIYQISLEAYPTGVSVSVLHLAGLSPFTPIREAWCETVEAAKRWGEKQARSLGYGLL